MGFMAKRPRVALKNPYFISLSRQVRLCPECGKRTRLNGMPLSPDGAYEVCDNPDCSWSQTLACPSWAVGKRADAPTGPKPKPRFSVVDGGIE